MLTNIYRGDYDTDADIEPAILEATREIFSRSVDKGIKQSHFDPSASFKKQIHHSADVFSAFRVHTMTKEVVSRLHDDNGRLRSFSEFAEAVQPYVSHQNRAWLQTEYSTAVRRAHDAADWQQFEAEKDVLPNLRWMPSTSAKPGQDHMEFWGTVLPVDDPFWKEHRPGDRWNCKCSLSSTDDEPTSRPTAKESTPQPGLKTKPTDAELFSQDHPYYADSCTSCPFKGSKLMALLHDLSGKKDCNSCSGVNKKLEGEEKRKTATIAQRVSKDIANWTTEHLEAKTINNQLVYSKTIYNNDTPIDVRKKFFTETIAKNIRNEQLEIVMECAKEFEQWLPDAIETRIEEGIHHNCNFKVYEAIWKAYTIECKAMMTDQGEKLYTMKIKK